VVWISLSLFEGLVGGGEVSTQKRRFMVFTCETWNRDFPTRVIGLVVDQRDGNICSRQRLTLTQSRCINAYPSQLPLTLREVRAVAI
jgi:hypothetical protein